jgi:hypothetical protein
MPRDITTHRRPMARRLDLYAARHRRRIKDDQPLHLLIIEQPLSPDGVVAFGEALSPVTQLFGLSRERHCKILLCGASSDLIHSRSRSVDSLSESRRDMRDMRSLCDLHGLVFDQCMDAGKGVRCHGEDYKPFKPMMRGRNSQSTSPACRQRWVGSACIV